VGQTDSFFAELRRRNVFRVGVAYAIVAWLVVEISSVVFPALNLPDWTLTFFIVLFIIGFPFALIFAWAYELTPEGLKKEKDVDRSQSITTRTGRKLDFMIIGVMAVAIAYFLVDKFVWVGEEPATDITVSEDRKSIAVLPFANRSANEEDAFFVDGIHDDLLTLLAKLGDLKVIARTTMVRLDPGMSMQDIGSKLGVATIVEGGVQRAGDRVRINAQLIDARTEVHLWAETYDRELTAANIFAVQTEIATAIAEALQATLSPQEQERLLPSRNANRP
jgi:TolB-like protein